MLATSWFLAVLAILLAWPVPILLATAKWSARSPFSALILWQAIALAGGLSMIGAMLTFGMVPLGNTLLAGVRQIFLLMLGRERLPDFGFWNVFALSAAGLLSAHLVFTLILTYIRIRSQRRRHHELLNLLSSPASSEPGTLVINHQTPVAYCLPGGSRSVTVLSDSLMELLQPTELRAVLIHENAHLTQRHHLLLWAFAAWRSALPWLPTSRLAQGSVNALIEMMADDAALVSVDRGTLVRAIALVATGTAPDAGPSRTPDPTATVPGEEPQLTSARIGRLIHPQPELSPAVRLAVITLAALLLAAPTALLLVPTAL